MINLQALHTQIAAITPIDGISVGDANNKATWIVQYPSGVVPAANILAQVQTAIANFGDPGFDPIDSSILKILFNHENRIRILEGKATITAAQFKSAVIALLNS